MSSHYFINVAKHFLLLLWLATLTLMGMSAIASMPVGSHNPRMARTRNPAAQNPKRRPHYNVAARIDPAVGKAFEDYVNRQPRPKATFAAHVEAALAEYVQRHGDPAASSAGSVD